MGTLDKLTKDDLFLSKEDIIKWDEWEKNTIYNDGVKEGMEQGIEKGIKQGLEQGIEQGFERGIEQGIGKGIEQGIIQNTTEMILSMLKNDIDIEKISKITNKSIKKIENIKEQENL